MSRRIARQIILQTLFEMDLANTPMEAALAHRLEEVVLEPKDSDYVRKVVTGVTDHRDELDRAINYFAKDWKVDRLAAVDRNILRFAIYEIRYMPEVPRKVSANEAVELAKLFSDEQSGKFVNGILGGVVDFIEDEEGHE